MYEHRTGQAIHEEFVRFNPTRHCLQNTRCLICGEKAKGGMVYCEEHSGAFAGAHIGWGQRAFYPMLYAHPEFNGVVPGQPVLADSEWIAND